MVVGAKASVSNRKLRAGVSILDTKVQVFHVLPVALIDYVQLKVTSNLDTTNKNPFVAEITFVLDTAVIQFAKGFSDLVTTSDQIQSINTQLGPTDSVTATDIVNVLLVFLRDFADTVGVSEQAAIELIKQFFDSVDQTDDQTLAIAKALADGVAMNDQADLQDGFVFDFTSTINNVAFASDSVVFDHARQLADLVSGADSLAISFSTSVSDTATPLDNTVLEASLNKDDSVTAADLVASKDTDLVKADSSSVTDALASFIEKAVADAAVFADALVFLNDLGKTDTVTADDNIVLGYTTEASDSISLSDMYAGTFGKDLSDSVSSSSAGSLFNQGYCDVTYFAEDYVGDARAFT